MRCLQTYFARLPADTVDPGLLSYLGCSAACTCIEETNTTGLYLDQVTRQTSTK